MLDPDDTPSIPRSHGIEASSSGHPVKPGYWVETLSNIPEPRVSLVHNLVTPEEAKHLMFLGAKKGMQKALIIPYGQKHLTQSTTRTNSAAWLDFGQDEVVKKVEKAYADITGIPEENGENLQVAAKNCTSKSLAFGR